MYMQTKISLMIAVFFMLIGSFCFAGIEQDIFIFFRGDVDGNKVINISDPITLNNYLFNGAERPITCPDVWDADASGFVNIYDSIFILNYLFSGHSAPSPVLVDCTVE